MAGPTPGESQRPQSAKFHPRTADSGAGATPNRPPNSGSAAAGVVPQSAEDSRPSSLHAYRRGSSNTRAGRGMVAVPCALVRLDSVALLERWHLQDRCSLPGNQPRR